ncbi:MAG: Uma2 family endonuclease [Blastocatellia bacterium]|nr:Uma2 family endonuclease [Blastocatellia bacterium]
MSKIRIENNVLDKKNLPTMYDLPSEEVGESGLPDIFHIFQSQLLRETFQPPNYSSNEVFVATDLNLYFDVNHPSWYKRPDWFASVGIPNLYEDKDLRLSYVVWQEGVTPLVIVELLSPSTENEDLGKTTRIKKSSRKGKEEEIPPKWEVYESILKVPYYFTYDHLTKKILAFQLSSDGYISFLPNSQGFYYLSDVELYLGLWTGYYEKASTIWLRWFDRHFNLIPTPLERVQAEKKQERIEKEQAQAEKERERAEKEALAEKLVSANKEKEALLAKLKALGIDPNNL